MTEVGTYEYGHGNVQSYMLVRVYIRARPGRIRTSNPYSYIQTHSSQLSTMSR